VRAPPQTYQMGEASFRGPTIETLARQEALAGTAASLTIDFSGLAKDKLLVLTNVSGRLQPGTAQFVVSIQVGGFTAAGARFDIFRNGFPATDDLDAWYNWQGEIMVRGRGGALPTLRATAVFDAGVANNQVAFAYNGYIIPRANVAEY